MSGDGGHGPPNLVPTSRRDRGSSRRQADDRAWGESDNVAAMGLADRIAPLPGRARLEHLAAGGAR